MSLNAEFEVGDAAQGLSCRDIRASYTALKYKCTNTLEHGGERCVSIDKGDGPVSWRRRENVYEQEVLCQLLPEQRWPNLQQWWETAIGTYRKAPCWGGPSTSCSLVW